MGTVCFRRTRRRRRRRAPSVYRRSICVPRTSHRRWREFRWKKLYFYALYSAPSRYDERCLDTGKRMGGGGENGPNFACEIKTWNYFKGDATERVKMKRFFNFVFSRPAAAAAVCVGVDVYTIQ